MNVEMIINFIIFGGFSLFCLIKYFVTTIKMRKYIKVKGKVISSKKDYLFTSDTVSMGNHCKYHFEYLGKSYDIEDSFYSGNPKLNSSDDVYFYVSPKNKNKFLKPEEVYLKKYYFIGTVFGIVALLLF